MSDAPETFNLKEQIAHIDQMLADAARKRQEIRLAPWQLLMTGILGAMAAGAGLFAAGAAWVKLLH